MIPTFVAPRVGAWIETHRTYRHRRGAGVAPRVGAWIETGLKRYLETQYTSHPVWVRGLKRMSTMSMKGQSTSHPVWVRGLKRLTEAVVCRYPGSHPVWVRGLKLENKAKSLQKEESHPVWVRGLKPSVLMEISERHTVAPRVGAWIETKESIASEICISVAPRVGAWIETETWLRKYLKK